MCFRSMLLSEIEKEERERQWYYSQLQGLSQRLAKLPRIDTVSSLRFDHGKKNSMHAVQIIHFSVLHSSPCRWILFVSSWSLKLNNCAP